METVTDLSLREIGVAASKVLGRPVEVRAESHIGRDLAVDSLALMNIRSIAWRPSRPLATFPN